MHASELRDPISVKAHAAVFGPLGTENPVDLIVNRMRAAIGVGILQDGQLLPSEPEMAEQLGVALFTIREALAQLREAGLILTKRGRNGGSTVQRAPERARRLLDERLRELSTAEVRDIGDWRLMLTAEAARLAAARASSRNVARLSLYVERLRDAPDVPATASALGRFHMELAAAAQSVRMSAAEVEFHAHHGWLMIVALEDEDRRPGAVQDLSKLVRAIDGRRESSARGLAEGYATRLTLAVQERRMKAVRNV